MAVKDNANSHINSSTGTKECGKLIENILIGSILIEVNKQYANNGMISINVLRIRIAKGQKSVIALNGDS